MRFAMSLVALGLPCFVSCGEDTPPGEESDTDTDTDSDTDTDTDTDVADAGDDIASATTIAYSDAKTPAASDAIGAMHALDDAAGRVVTLQRQDGGNEEIKAGPPFAFPEQGIPTDEAAIQARLTELGV